MRIWKCLFGCSFFLFVFGLMLSLPLFIPGMETSWSAPILALSTLPTGIALVGLGATALYRHFRVERITIVVSEPLCAAFLAQEQRLLQREQLKTQINDLKDRYDRLTSEIETFNAGMTAETREAWYKRPGPYGK